MSREERADLVGEVSFEIRANQSATAAFDDVAFARLGVNRTDGRCLDIVDREGPMTAGRLAEASGLSTGATTTALDRLERAGYVRRVRDTTDRRKVLVEITDQARRRSREIWGPIAEQAGASFDDCTDEQLLFLRDFLRAGNAMLAEHTARVQALGPPGG